uniref:Uncharacterized protein n=1 Tax=Nothobranchius rachovii TaxID=451742 RepID=A0A1A8NTY1_9TELE
MAAANIPKGPHSQPPVVHPPRQPKHLQRGATAPQSQTPPVNPPPGNIRILQTQTPHPPTHTIPQDNINGPPPSLCDGTDQRSPERFI